MPAKKIISPILLAPGDRRCCQPAYNGITSTLAVGTGYHAGNENNNNLWNAGIGNTIWSLAGNGTAGVEAGGSVKFGICCATEITLRLYGNMRVISDGLDTIAIYLNGALIWSTASSNAAGQAWYDYYYGIGPITNPTVVYPYYEGALGSEINYHDETITLETRTCGNLIEIVGASGATDPTTPVSGAGWSAEILSLPPIVP
jgi:hypothetical protein